MKLLLLSAAVISAQDIPVPPAAGSDTPMPLPSSNLGNNEAMPLPGNEQEENDVLTVDISNAEDGEGTVGITNTSPEDPMAGHNVEDFVQITKYIPDVIPLLVAAVPGYATVDYEKIASYGCWCGKLNAGRDRYGGPALDDFDEICKRWFRLRHCLVLEGGTCRTVKALDSYYVDIPNGVLSDDADFHCHPTSLLNDEAQKSCILNICRVDYIYAKELLEKYVELGIGSRDPLVCDNGDRNKTDQQRHNTCEVTDSFPYVSLLTNSGLGNDIVRRSVNDVRREKRMSKHRLARLLNMNDGQR